MTHGETRKPTRCPDCNGRDWQPRSDGRCNECGDKADQERTQEQDAVAALRKRVAELERRLQIIDALARHIKQMVAGEKVKCFDFSRKDGE